MRLPRVEDNDLRDSGVGLLSKDGQRLQRTTDAMQSFNYKEALVDRNAVMRKIINNEMLLCISNQPASLRVISAAVCSRVR